LFRASTDPHDTTVLGLEEFTVAQRLLAAFQKQADIFTVSTETAQATLAARLEVQVQLGSPFGLGFDSLMNHQH
jgi:hypothetical protein